MTNAANSRIYAEPPINPPALSDCSFYHSMDLPGLGLQEGTWDLRDGFDAYFAGHDFAGERVLDLGTASGALAFEIERRGAREVVGFDLAEGLVYDCRLPIDEATIASFRHGLRQIKNGFWLTRALLKSNVNVVYGHVKELPDELGTFDTVMIGNILQHLQDPVGAVLQAVRRTDHILITESDWLPGIADDLACMLMFDIQSPFSWYQVKPRLLQNLLQRWGFTDQTLTLHTQKMVKGPTFDEAGRESWERATVPTNHYTLSARRKNAGSRAGSGNR